MKPENFSVVAIINAIVAESWGRKSSDEHREHVRLCGIAGSEPAGLGTARVPGHALRDLTVAGSGGYLAVNDQNAGYITALAGDSAAVRLGVQVASVPAATAVYAQPTASSGATAYWLTSESAQAAESAPTIVAHVSQGRLLASYCEISKLLLTQSPTAEAVVRAELHRATAAALDAAVFSGTGGSGEPAGIVGAAGVGSFSGATLARDALRDAQATIGPHITDPARVAFVADHAVAAILGKRPTGTSSTDTPGLWDGSSFDGQVQGVRAVASAAMPASTAIIGDWGSVSIVEFAGGLQLEVDPFSGFQTGVVGVRLLLPADILLNRPAAFAVATDVS